MCNRIQITFPLLLHHGHQIPTKTLPFSSSSSSFSFKSSNLCSSFSSSAMAPLINPRSITRAAMLAGALNLAIIVLGSILFPLSLRRCGGREKSAVAGVLFAAALRLGSMLRIGIAQGHAAVSIASSAAGDRRIEDVGDDSRSRRRRRYRQWLWWTRFGMLVNALQFVMALYLMYVIMKDFAREGGDSTVCFLGHAKEDTWKKILIASFLVLVWLVVVIQCIMGSDVLRWRSFYATQHKAWKVHYSEVFDHGIREALCCLGRVKYLSVLEEDEVFSVARLLGDLVAYRATGTGHLELLAGLALLQSHKQPIKSYEYMEAPLARIQEATILHQFAEAAYTGPLLDFGRNPVLFPCSWLYRQGVLTPWTRNRRPILEGDNCLRGHAAAFLKCANLSPQFLRRGRVIQKKREAAYFIVVLHHLRSVVIAIRGTETPEDLITDGLCGECFLSEEDLDGLINSDQLLSSVKESVVSSFPHYGHSGIVESSRELYMQVDCSPGENSTSETAGFLSSLLGPGCECEGYNVRLVGHSLGGAVATLLGLRLKGRYPNLHVYAYGTLPCVDSIIAEACSDFVTTIVYNDEFSSRLSVNSILRLRSAAIQALSDDASTNSAVITKLARKILNVRRHHINVENHSSASPCEAKPGKVEDGNHLHRRPVKHSIQGGAFLCGLAVSCMTNTPIHQRSSNVINGTTLEPLVSSGTFSLASQSNQPKQESLVECSTFDGLDSGILNEGDFDYNIDMPKDEILPKDGVSADLQIEPLYGENINHTFLSSEDPIQHTDSLELKEMFLPGLIIHIIPERTCNFPSNGAERTHKAYVANRENFKDLVVSPYMFLDHLPWRCACAMQRVLEAQKPQLQQHDHLISSREDIV